MAKCSRKAREKWDMSLKPNCMAMSVTERNFCVIDWSACVATHRFFGLVGFAAGDGFYDRLVLLMRSQKMIIFGLEIIAIQHESGS